MEFVQSSLCLNNLKDKLDEDVLHCVMTMSHPREAIFKAKILKEDGNKAFRQGNIIKAASIYEKALQFGAVGIPSNDEEASLMTNLAISLNLNIAACCLKINDFSGCIRFCTYVLDFDAMNTKAFFRRAKASIGLNLWDEALRDLKEAISINPDNNEIKSTLKLVEEKSAGKDNHVFKGKSKLCKSFLQEASSMDLDSPRENIGFSSKFVIDDSDAAASSSSGPSTSHPSGSTYSEPFINKKNEEVISRNEEVDFMQVDEKQPVGQRGNSPYFDPLHLTGVQVLPPIKVTFSIKDLRGLSTSVESSNLDSVTFDAPVTPHCTLLSTGESSGDMDLDSSMEDVSAVGATSPIESMHRAEGIADPSFTKSPAGGFSPNCTHLGGKSNFKFYLKGKPDQSLKITSDTYERLSRGESCQFYDKRRMHHMVVRVHRPESSISRTGISSETTETKKMSEDQQSDTRDSKMSVDTQVMESNEKACQNQSSGQLFKKPLTAKATQSPGIQVVQSFTEVHQTKLTVTGGNNLSPSLTGIANPIGNVTPIFVFQAFKSRGSRFHGTQQENRTRRRSPRRDQGCHHDHHHSLGIVKTGDQDRKLGQKNKHLPSKPGDVAFKVKVRVLDNRRVDHNRHLVFLNFCAGKISRVAKPPGQVAGVQVCPSPRLLSL